MLPWLIGALAAAGAALWALVERNRATKALATADRWHNTADLAMGRAESAADELRAERLTRVDERERLERVIAEKNAGITRLEEDLDACQDPAVVRARLRRLLGGPASGIGTSPSATSPRVPG